LTRIGCKAIRERVNAVCITGTFAICVFAIRRFQRQLWMYRALTVKPSGLQTVYIITSLFRPKSPVFDTTSFPYSL
jgi:hypothetical protein